MSLEDMTQVLRQLPVFTNNKVILGLSSFDDAGVYKLSGNLAVIQTVDIFAPVVDDPYTYGQIVTSNCLSDVYAMGGKPAIAFNMLWIPKTVIDDNVISEILKGAKVKAKEAGISLIGRQIMYDEEIKYGLAVYGIINPKNIVAKAGSKIKDSLILTKPLGTGLISAALRKGKVDRKLVKEIIDSMTQLNKVAAAIMLKYEVHACTDITGFGFTGHAFEMAELSKVGFKINSDAIPKFTGVEKYAKDEFMEGISSENKTYLLPKINVNKSVSEQMLNLLFDAQTSGGLLISLPSKDAKKCIKELKQCGMKRASIIGEVVPEKEGRFVIR